MDEVGNAERTDDDVGCIADDENEQYRYDPRCPYRHAVRRGHVDAADISQDVVLVGNEGTRPRNRMDRKAARPGVYFVSGRASHGRGAGRGEAGRKGKERVGVRSGRSWLSETHATRNFYHPHQSRREWLVIALYSFRFSNSTCDHRYTFNAALCRPNAVMQQRIVSVVL